MNPTTASGTRVRARRRAIQRWGLLSLVALSVTACIFDESDYRGGGRVDRGATAGSVPPEDTSAPPNPTSVPTSDAGTSEASADAG